MMKTDRILLLTVLTTALWAAGCQRSTPEAGSDADPDHAAEPGAPDEHAHEDVVRLTPEELAEFDIKVAVAGPGVLRATLEVPAEVQFNPDRLVHVRPRVPGVASEVRRKVGDRVRTGDVLAVLESRELGRAKADYLAALARERLARANYRREEKLRQKNISSERDYLQARQNHEEAVIQRKEAEHALHALGVSEAEVRALPDEPDDRLTRYELVSPQRGVVVQRHLVLGEVLEGAAAEAPFVVADLSSVWVELTLYQKDLPRVRKGQKAILRFGHGVPDATGVIDYVTPSVEESTRTASARVVLANPEGHWRPGLFITGVIEVGEESVPLVVPKTAVLFLNEQQVIFVEHEDGFEPTPVTLGRSDREQVEITAGLNPGDRYAAENALTLKAQLIKGELDAGHSH
jgi:cobalt-zinc-cadmium efflux system membrane fusion protein